MLDGVSYLNWQLFFLVLYEIIVLLKFSGVSDLMKCSNFIPSVITMF